MTFDGSTVITFNTFGESLESGSELALIILSDGVEESYYYLYITLVEQDPGQNNPPYFVAFTSEKTLTKFVSDQSYQIPEVDDDEGDIVSLTTDLSCCIEWT